MPDFNIVLTARRYKRLSEIRELVVLGRTGRSATFRICPSTGQIVTRDDLSAVRSYSEEVGRDSRHIMSSD
jgi:hypothetical protein